MLFLDHFALPKTPFPNHNFLFCFRYFISQKEAISGQQDLSGTSFFDGICDVFCTCTFFGLKKLWGKLVPKARRERKGSGVGAGSEEAEHGSEHFGSKRIPRIAEQRVVEWCQRPGHAFVSQCRGGALGQGVRFHVPPICFLPPTDPSLGQV